MPDPAGSLIAFEGPEGAGKSTQLALAAEALRRSGYSIEVTAEPGGTPLGQSLRRLLLHDAEHTPTALAELFLMLADRAQHVSQVIRPALARGKLVLTDRFSASTLAYQGYGRGLDLHTVATADAWARQGVETLLNILLDCPAATGLARARGGDRFHEEDMHFHERVRSGFLALAAAEPERWCVVDSTRPQPAVHAEVIDAILRSVGRPAGT